MQAGMHLIGTVKDASLIFRVSIPYGHREISDNAILQHFPARAFSTLKMFELSYDQNCYFPYSDIPKIGHGK